MTKDLRSFLSKVQKEIPGEFKSINKMVSPEFEINAIQIKLEEKNNNPILFSNNIKNLLGEKSLFKFVTNIFAERKFCALSLDLPVDKCRMEPALEFDKRSTNPIKPLIIKKSEARIKDVIWTGKDINLFKLPILVHHEMDALPYLTSVVVAADPDTGIYNSSFHRQLVRSSDELGLWMSPRHLNDYFRRAEKKGEPLPIAHVIGHHPGFFLGTESLIGIDKDEYDTIGGILGEPLRLVPSEAYGEKLLVPTDAEIIIEGELLPNVRKAEGPFGEFSGYYGPQRWSWVMKVKAITFRKDAIYMNISPARADHHIVGAIPKEGGMYHIVKDAVPTVKEVCFPKSGCCRFNCYISIDKQNEGEARTAALAVIPFFDEVKHVIVVDDDIDVYNEQDVQWAVATRVQADKDVSIISNVRGGALDPSQTHPTQGAKMIIDATKPIDRPFPERVKVPKEILNKTKLEDYFN